MSYWQLLFLFFLGVVYLAGALSALHALRYARTSQGAIAWVLTLILFPYVGLFLYWLLGPHKFHAYLDVIEKARHERKEEISELAAQVAQHKVQLVHPGPSTQKLLESIYPWPVTSNNEVQLLINGEDTFEAIFRSLKEAKEYVLTQFYILRNDEIGSRFRDALIQCVQRGVKVYLLIDSIGSLWLADEYVRELRAHGVALEFFGAVPRLFGKYKVNFRNHRKIVIVDGEEAFVGGHNVGDEYLGASKQFGEWRDTHISIRGPAVSVVQSSFLEDWYFVTGQMPDVHFGQMKGSSAAGQAALPLSTGPTSQLEDCSLMFMEAITSAQKRFWIASPYFVPDEPLVQSLQAAALRGVDVRVLLPLKPDHTLVWLAGISYFDEMLDAGVRLYRYFSGFLHQKVFLADDQWSSVGTANLDNRSLRLNFEMSVLVFDKLFALQVEKMLIEDFKNAEELTVEDIESFPLWLTLAASMARLFSPIL